ncbi:MAG: DUF2608 domain-containing protein [Puniceicoccales bacterium]|nr:DUF2608 domain-containing protein [Puniceicoccales bacterium]
MAKSQQDVCAYLGQALQLTADETAIIIVDVDETLIGDGSDLKSFHETGNFEQIKVVNEPLLEELRRLDAPNVKAIAMTSAMVLWLGMNEQLMHCSLPKGQRYSQVRSEAMEFLGMPFSKHFGNTAYSLSLVHMPPDPQSTSQSTCRLAAPEFTPNLQRIILSPELERRGFFPDLEMFHYTYRIPFGPMRQSFYVKDTVEGIGGPEMRFVQLLACPIYENGVIFSNFLDSSQGWQKGLVMRSFLLGMDRSEWPRKIIAVDDNLLMLQSMQKVCAELCIMFFGIHFVRPAFWIFGPPNQTEK